MSQNSIIPADGTGIQYQGNVSNAFNTVTTNFSGPSAPSPTYSNQFWADTTAGLVRQRNDANTAWIIVGILGSTAWGHVGDLSATATGSANAYAVTVNGLYAIASGVKVWFKANFTCTSDGTITNTPTLNVNAGGAVKILKYGVSGLGNNDIISGAWTCVMYDGAYWQLLSPVSGIGEYLFNTNGGGTALTSGTAANITSLSIPAGNWDISGSCGFAGALGTSFSFLQTFISNNVTPGSNTLPSFAGEWCGSSQSPNSNFNWLQTGVERVSLSSAVTHYLVGAAVFAGGTFSGYGRIQARRVN